MPVLSYRCSDDAICMGERTKLPCIANLAVSHEELLTLSQIAEREMRSVPSTHLFSPTVLQHIATVSFHRSYHLQEFVDSPEYVTSRNTSRSEKECSESGSLCSENRGSADVEEFVSLFIRTALDRIDVSPLHFYHP